MATPPPLGTVNGFIPSNAMILDVARTFRYNGTTLGLTLAALDAGVEVGQIVDTEYRSGRSYTLTPTGGGDRTPGGVWMTQSAGTCKHCGTGYASEFERMRPVIDDECVKCRPMRERDGWSGR